MATHFTKKSPNFVVNQQSTQAMAQANNSFLIIKDFKDPKDLNDFKE